MLKEIRDNSIVELNEIVALIKENQDFLINCPDILTREKVATVIQNELIRLGNFLEEKYMLGNSKILKLLEKYCEDIYLYLEERTEHHGSELVTDLESIVPALYDSIVIDDNILSLVVIVKDESDYIIEWLEYHRMVGVSHFYIYDNDSKDNIQRKLRWYIDNNVVTYINWPGESQQIPAYNDALRNYKFATKYMGFIDADEFLVPVLNKTLPEIIDDIFRENVRAGGIGVNWRVYGSSFYEVRTEGLVIERFKYRAKDFDRNGFNYYIKTICNPRLALEFRNNSHNVVYLENYYCISENGSVIPWAFFYDGMCSKLRLNHYSIKSKEEYFQRMKKGKADQIIAFTDEEIERRYNKELVALNSEFDPIMDKYIDELKMRVDSIERGITFNTLIMTTPKDYLRLQSNHHRLTRTLPGQKILFVGNSEVGELVNRSVLGERVGFINEDAILTFSDVHKIMEDALKEVLNGQQLPRGITGWYYQQFLKMQYAYMCEDTYYMVWDGDTVPCRPFSMFREGTGTPYLDLKKEYHEEYFITLSRILPGMHKSIEKSFISEHMLMKCEIMKQLIDDIESNQAVKGKKFWEKIIYAIDADQMQNSSFSEFETYGTYVCARYPTAYRIRNWHSFRQAGEFFDPDTISDDDYEWLGHDFHAVSFEKGHFVREDHKNLFDNKKYQEKLSARQMLEIAQEEYKEGYLEIWDEPSPPLSSAHGVKDEEKPVSAERHREYEIYERLGDSILPRNINQAYLCYENAEFLCIDEGEKERLKSKKEKLMADENLEVKKTAIVILSYNNIYLMQKCLESIRQSCAPDSYTVIVVDNASTDGVTEWLKQQSDIKLLLNDENIGFPAGCNMGIQCADPDTDIFLLNNDTRMTHNALFWLRMGLYEDEFVGATGCVANYCTLDQFENVEFALPGEYLEYAEKVNIPCENPYEEKNRLSGFAMLICRSALNKAGALDEMFTPGYFEDEDLCMRIHAEGYRLVVCHNSFIYHAGSQSFIQREDLETILAKNQKYMIQKWGYDTFAYSVMLDLEKRLIDRIERKREDSFWVLVVGSGSGNALSRIKYLYPNAQVIGIEKNELAVQNAIKSLFILCLDWKRERIPFAKHCFDYIIYVNRLGEYTTEKEAEGFLGEYLKSNGKLLME